MLRDWGKIISILSRPGAGKRLCRRFAISRSGGTVAGTRKILDFARKHKAPLMSRRASFRHEFGMEAAACECAMPEPLGRLSLVTATLHSRYSLPGWMIYGQHPVWTAMTLMGPRSGFRESMYEYKDTCPRGFDHLA